MSLSPLQRVRQKVEAGEVLTDDELSLLRAEAQRESGPLLKVALAQALINADVPAQALRLLETVHRDYPLDTEAWLARARALFALERWGEAESALQRVLQRQPKDIDALNALALVCLRRGELTRASSLVDEVLQLDPLDNDAQALRAELDATDLPSPVGAEQGTDREPVSLAAFEQALQAQLKAQSTPHLMQGPNLVVRLGKGGVARLTIRGLYQSFLESGRPLDEAVASVGAELAERSLGLPEEAASLLDVALPVLRDEAFLDRGVGSACREGPAGLWVFYALEDPELFRYVPSSALATHGVSLEQLDEAAWRNLAAKPAEVRPIELYDGHLKLTQEASGLWAVAAGDGHDGARLLTAPQQERLREAIGPGPYRVYLGLRELSLVCRDDESAGVLEGMQSAGDGIAGEFVLDGGRLHRRPEWKGLTP